MDQGVIDYITNIFDIPKLTQQVSAVQMPLPLSRLAEIPLDGSVNQCQGFCYNSKKDVFALIQIIRSKLFMKLIQKLLLLLQNMSIVIKVY